MSNKEVKIVITAVDEITGVLSNVESAFDNLKSQLEELSSAFEDCADGSFLKSISEAATTALQLTTVLGQVGTILKSVATGFVELYNASKQDFSASLQKLYDVLSGIGSVIGGLGGTFWDVLQSVTGADLSLSGLAKSSLQFGENIERVQNVTGELGDTIKGKLTEAAQYWALESQYSTDQVTAGMVDMAQAGLDTDEILQSLKATIALSTSGNLDFARSAEILTNTMNAFNEKAFNTENTMRYADVLTNVANSSATSVDQIGQALTNCGAVAGTLGFSIEDVGVAIGLMGNQFIKSGKAGTAMKNIMQRFAAENSSVVKAIDEYNLEAFEAEMQSGNLGGAMKELIKATADLDETEKARVATMLAGSYGMTGLLAIMGTTIEEYERMEAAVQKNNTAWGVHEGMMETSYGKMLQISSIVQTLASELYSKFEPAINKALGGIIEFGKGLFVIEEGSQVTLKSLSQLAEESVKWGESLSQGIQSAIKGIRSFVEGDGLQSILDIGTNIIKGIADGIHQARESGDLKAAFDGIIQKAAAWIGENKDSIIQIGTDIIETLKQSITDNHDTISQAINDVWEIISASKGWESSIKALGESFAGPMVEGFIQGFVEQWSTYFDDTLMSLINGDLGGPTSKGEDSGNSPLGTKPGQSTSGGSSSTSQAWQERGKGDADTYSQGFQEQYLANDPYKNSQLSQFESNYALNQENGRLLGHATGQAENEALLEEGALIQETAGRIGTDSATSIKEALDSMDTQQLETLRTAIEEVGTTTQTAAQTMSTAFTEVATSAETSFTQMSTAAQTGITSATDAVRTGCTTMVQIMRNQAEHLNTAFREALLNITNIAKNQMENVTQAIEQGMDSCSTAVESGMETMTSAIESSMDSAVSAAESGAEGMVSALESGMSGMAAAAETQMAAVVSAVSAGMAEAQAIASTPITINITSNITKKITTSYTSEGIKQTMANIAGHSMVISRPNTMVTSGGGAAINKIPGHDKGYTFTIPVVVDGREVARATAKYSQSELDRLNKRNSRKRGE